MKRWMLVACTGLALLYVGLPLCADIITFTNRDDWSSYLHGRANFATDFNSVQTDVSFAETAQVFNAINVNLSTGQTNTFPMFKASVVGGPSPAGTNLVDAPPFQSDTNFDTTHALLYGDSTTMPVWQFLQPVKAFGADFQTSGSPAEIVLTPANGGDSIALDLPRSGFFGFVETSGALYNSINFLLAPSLQIEAAANRNSSFTVAFDNLTGMAVPEPSGLVVVVSTLGLTGLCGLCWLHKR
jgi:hypothetical protein